MSTLPHIVSRVNGMKIPLLPGQAGILHRFEQKENKLVIASTSFNPLTDARDSDAELVFEGVKDPSEIAAQTPVPRSHVSPPREKPAEAAPVLQKAAKTAAPAESAGL